MNEPVASNGAELAWGFPSVEPGAKPLGGRILVQLRRVKKKSQGGLILVSETKEAEKWQNMIAKVIEIGPLAYRHRDSMQPWPEGSWCHAGDFVRVPKWGGDRWEVPIDGEDEPALFAIFNDHEVIAKVTCDPLSIKAFV